MAYTPRTIKDRVAVGDDVFIVEDLGNSKIKLTPAPTHVSEPGTPVNKALLQPIENELASLSANKVDKVSGKGLSTNDFTTAEKNKLAGIAAGAQVNAVKTTLVAEGQVYHDGSTNANPYFITISESNSPYSFRHRFYLYSVSGFGAIGRFSLGDNPDGQCAYISKAQSDNGKDELVIRCKSNYSGNIYYQVYEIEIIEREE